MIEGLSRFAVIAHLQVSQPQRQPQPNRLRERLQRFVEANQRGRRRVGVGQQDGVLKTVFFGLRIELNGEPHCRNRVLDVPAFLVRHGKQSVNCRSFDFTRKRRFERATGSRNVLAREIDTRQTHDRIRV